MRALIVLLTLLGLLPALAAEPGRSVNENPDNEIFLSNDQISGWLLDNPGNAGQDGGGFNLLCHVDYPGKSIYHPQMVGLNFEHIFNGATMNNDIAMFTPRKESGRLKKTKSVRQASLVWEAENTSWGVDCHMRYHFIEPNAIELNFEAIPRQEKWPQGYLAFMWASYMARTAERQIHFWGTDGVKEGWMAFGEDTQDAQGFETGTVAFQGVDPLPYEAGAQDLNIVEHPTKRFVLPFYYGLLDGDHALSTTEDRLAYIVMFDQTESIRFALWNFIKDNKGQADPHSPAWDWQFVVRNPEVGRRYTYRMRVVIVPFTNRDDILALYHNWPKKVRQPVRRYP